MDQIKRIALRILAVFVYSAMSIIAGASFLGDIPIWKAAVLAGIAAASQVIEKLARAYADDGKITLDELDAAFAGTSEPSSKANISE
jgi:hypothetical protein